jgi:protein SCO1
MNVKVFTPKSAALFITTGIGLFFYFRYEKAKLLEQRGEDGFLNIGAKIHL